MDKREAAAEAQFEEVKRIVPSLKAWFESQDIPQSRQASVMCYAVGLIIGEVASSPMSLTLGLLLHEKAINQTAAKAYAEKQSR